MLVRRLTIVKLGSAKEFFRIAFLSGIVGRKDFSSNPLALVLSMASRVLPWGLGDKKTYASYILAPGFSLEIKSKQIGL